ncbi:MAG TPA: histidine kinase dimerization/phosphoacceptor domain -containing protein [Ignavibacteriaceae bacterium]|nr:histidine kinase dimerization/phosphoacceptor domain -containing protein [Ignavibacteriaceae bacterium]
MNNFLAKGILNRLMRIETAIWLLTLLLIFGWPQLISNLFNAGFLPHIHCYLDTTNLVWLHLISDSAIGLSYIAISAALIYLVLKAKRDIPFPSVFLAFGLFIISCGATHIMEVWTLWNPVYWLSGGVKLVTAAASVTTAVALPFFIPKILNLIKNAKLVEENTLQLGKINLELEKQISEKEQAEELLKKTHDELEIRVRERTSELERTNADLRAEIRRHEKTQEMLKGTEARLFSMVNSAMDAIISINSRQSILLINEAAEKMFLCKADEVMGTSILKFIPEPFIYLLMEQTNQDGAGSAKTSKEKLSSITGIKSSMEQFPIEVSISQVEIAGEKLYTLILRDITGRKKTEEKIEASLKEKEVLLKEVHHRVKNNLQIISSLLNLQSNYIEDKEALEVFKESQNRVKSMALIHEKLYQSGNLSQINIKDYIKDLSAKLFSSYRHESKNIQLNLNIEETTLEVDKCIAVGLILNELISNSLKHAFADRSKGKLNIDFNRKEDKLILIAADNGVGFPQDFDFQNTETLGLQLVFSLIDQHRGTIEYDKSEGAKFKITLNIN